MTVVVLTELYWPEETSTGFFLTGIAEDLAREHPVTVLCAQPTYSQRGSVGPRHERRNGVEIRRVRSTLFPKDALLGRLLNMLTIGTGLFWEALRALRPGDRAVAVTNPPVLPYLTLVAARLRGADFAVLLHDVYPEVLEATGALARDGAAARMLGHAARFLYRRAGRVVALGRDAAALVRERAGLVEGDPRVTIIPNWGDVDQIRPQPREANPVLVRLGLAEKFVVQWLGNMGRTHAIEDLVRAAAGFRDDARFHFLFVGWGAKKAWLEQEVARQGVGNTTILPPCPREDLSQFLGACDLAVIAFVPGMAGVSVPSRLYNVMASGRPLLMVADAASEAAQVVAEEGVGWTVTPGDDIGIRKALESAATSREMLEEMGRRARSAAERKYSREAALQQWRVLLAEEWR